MPPKIPKASQPLFPMLLEEQLKDQRRTVDFDTFDIHAQQLLAMLGSGQIWISPKYQRKFRWMPDRRSLFIESIMLGLPIPSLFMATNKDNTWEVVDGVQRLSTLISFAGNEDLRNKFNIGEPLVLSPMQKLSRFDGLTFEQIPQTLQLHFYTRPVKVITLNDKSDEVVRYDLFERLNTGGINLSNQEIRDCVSRGTFADKLEELAGYAPFRQTIRLTPLQQRDASAEEYVLRFFAFRNNYKKFNHEVKTFLDDYMRASSKSFDYQAGDLVFKKTFDELAKVFPTGIRRPGGKKTTPLNLYEGIAVGASLALDKNNKLHTTGIDKWLGSAELQGFTTGATNSLPQVVGRIEFCRDRFSGKPYVPKPTA